MSVIHPGLFLVIERFPDHREILYRLYAADEAFQTLCDNYQECFQAVEYWNHSKAASAPDRQQEYGALLNELETEIMQCCLESRDYGI